MEIGLLGAAGHVLFQLFGGALANGNAVLVAHELEDLFVVVVAGHAHTGGLDLTAQTQHCNIGGAAADVDDHAALRLGDVDAGTESGGNGLVDQIHLTGTGGHHSFHHSIALDAGDRSRHADCHPGLDHMGVVYLLDKAADQLTGHGVVADNAVFQRKDRGNIVRGAAHHGQSLIADFQHGVFARVHCHNAGLVEYNALPRLCDDDGGGTKVDTDIVLCHKFSVPFWFLYQNNGLLMQAGNHTSLQYSIVAVKSIPVLNGFPGRFCSAGIGHSSVFICSGGSSACSR